MQLSDQQKRQVAELLTQFAPQTVECILDRFDTETRDQIRLSLAAHSPREPADQALQEFARFLHFRDGRSMASPSPDRRHARSATDQPHDRPVFEFQNILDLDNACIDALLGAAPPELTIETLCCSPRRFIERVLARLSDEEADFVTRQINKSGPRDFDEMQAIQNRYCQFVRELAGEGVIQWPLPGTTHSPAE